MAKTKSSPAQDIAPSKPKPSDTHAPEKDVHPLAGDKQQLSYDVKTEPDTVEINKSGHLEIKGKHVPSGPNETRLFQDDIGSKEYLTKAQAKAKGKHWKD